MFLDIPELSGKRVGLLKEIVPGLSRIAIFGIPLLSRELLKVHQLPFVVRDVLADGLHLLAFIRIDACAEELIVGSSNGRRRAARRAIHLEVDCHLNSS